MPAVQPCMHTHVRNACLCALLLSMHVLLLREERGLPVGDEHERVCADCIVLTPILSLHSASLLLTCVFPNSEITACSPRKPANITADVSPHESKYYLFLLA